MAGITVIGAAKRGMACDFGLLWLFLEISHSFVLFLFIVHNFTIILLTTTRISLGNAWIVVYVVCLIVDTDVTSVTVQYQHASDIL